MKAYYLRLLALSALAPIAACAEADRGPSGPEVAIDVAPLTLPGTLGVSYALAVYNQDPTDYTTIFDVDGDAINTTGLVWHQQDVTSNQFGNGPGGDISYVGPCDASVGDNWVALAVNRVDVGNNNGSYSGEAGAFPGTDNLLDDQNSAFTTSPGSNDLDPDFVNPAPYNKALVLKFPCEENEDTRVTFNLTAMRDADQGFFDIAVNFEDIFCSMKIDTCYDGNEPITLLFGDEEGEGRVETAVIASACTAGTDDADTIMWMAPLTVSCDGGVEFTLDPTGGATGTSPGQQGNQDCATATVAATGGTPASGTVSFLSSVLTNQGNIPDGTTCWPMIGGQAGASFTLDGAATAGTGNVVVPFTAVDVGSVPDLPSVPYTYPLLVVQCDINGVTTAYAETTLTIAADGTDPVAGVSYDLCYALYWGEEDLECDPPGEPCNKEWWNVAINIDDLRDQGLTNCTVKTAITASSSTDVSPPTFVNGTLPGPGQTYGYVAFDADLTDNSGAPTCFQGPMGSDYAAVKYGATKDMLGGEPFPQLCASFAQGDASPKQLKDISGYFFDEAATLADALYAGRIEAFTNAAGELVRFKKVRLDFAEMGAAIGGQCGSTVKNDRQIYYFDASWPTDGGTRQELYWRGIGPGDGIASGGGLVGTELVGSYLVQGWRRNAKTEDWQKLHDDAIALDFSNRTDLTILKAFARGASFEASGYDSFAIDLTRIDGGQIEDIGVAFGFVGGFSMHSGDTPPFIFALCSNSTLECTCHDSSGDLTMTTLECLGAVDVDDVYFVD